MRILAVETTATAASCCLWEDGRIVGRFATNAGLTHSRTLLPMVSALLDTVEVSPAETDVLAVAVGPGSFTGVRIGVAVAKGLALSGDKPCVGVSTLAAMARKFEGLPFDGTVCAVMDARCQQVYAALFEVRGGVVSRLTPDEAIGIDRLRERLAEHRSVVLVGDGAELCANAFSDLPQVQLSPASLRMQDAVGVALEAADAVSRGETCPARELLPVYLRVPQAERERLARLAAENQ